MTDRRSTWKDAESVATLEEAKTVLSRLAPDSEAPAADRHAFHVRAADVYRQVADTDQRHYHEAHAYAQVEINHAERLNP